MTRLDKYLRAHTLYKDFTIHTKAERLEFEGENEFAKLRQSLRTLERYCDVRYSMSLISGPAFDRTWPKSQENILEKHFDRKMYHDAWDFFKIT